MASPKQWLNHQYNSLVPRPLFSGFICGSFSATTDKNEKKRAGN